MDPNDAIDAQFNRAVQIVQSLPKTGPIQTGYEEKLAMYSLYKQATIGNVKGPRPPMWDMLGRAKWDAWAKHKDLESYEAKCKYVDELLHVLRKYSDKTVAKGLVQELEAFGSDPQENVVPGSESNDSGSDSESSSSSQSPSRSRRLSKSLQLKAQAQGQQLESESEDDIDTEQEEPSKLGKATQQPLRTAPSVAQSQTQSLHGRPQSSLSSNRYRTPMGGSLVISPQPMPVGTGVGVAPNFQQQPFSTVPYSSSQMQGSNVYVHPQSVQHGWSEYSDPTSLGRTNSLPQTMPGALRVNSVPPVQPMPPYETPSAFEGPSPPIAPTASSPNAYPSPYSGVATSTLTTQHHYPSNMYPGHSAYRNSLSMDSQGGPLSSLPAATSIQSSIERAVEGLQAHCAALQERIESIEARAGLVSGGPGTPYRSRSSLGGHHASPSSGSHFSPFNSGHFGGPSPKDNSWSLSRWAAEFDASYFDWEHMGLWSTVLAPIARLTKFLLRIVTFLVSRRHRSDGGTGLSPGLLVLRRLLLDVSFVLCAVYVGRRVWRSSGMRRREVMQALLGVWTAIAGRGTSSTRVMVDRGV